MITNLTMPMLAQSSPGVGDVPADFVKHFIIMLMSIVGMWIAYKKGQKGTKAEPLSIEQPLEVRTVKSLDEKIAAIARENLRQHNATAERINKVIQGGEDRASTILSALHAMETRMTTATLKEIKDIHERLNPVAERVNGHHEAIKRIDIRCGELWDWICKIWEHIAHPKKAK